MSAQAIPPSTLIDALRKNDLSAVVSALDSGGNVEEADIHGQTGLPLRTACFGGNIDIVAELIRRGADVNTGDGLPLRAVLRARQPKIAALLIANGAKSPPDIATQLEALLAAQAAPETPASEPDNTPPPEMSARTIPDAPPAETPEEPRLPLPDNSLDYVPTHSWTANAPLIEEVDITSSYGVDTNLLTLDFLRLNENLEAQKINDSKPPAGKKKRKT